MCRVRENTLGNVFIVTYLISKFDTSIIWRSSPDCHLPVYLGKETNRKIIGLLAGHFFAIYEWKLWMTINQKQFTIYAIHTGRYTFFPNISNLRYQSWKHLVFLVNWIDEFLCPCTNYECYYPCRGYGPLKRKAYRQ